MSTPAFPSEFPCPLIEGTQTEADTSLLRAEFETGDAQQRRRNPLLRHVFNLAWVIQQADAYGRFVQWVNRYGFDWFTLQLPSALAGQQGSATVPHTVRFIADPTAELVPTRNGFYWRVTLQAEWEPLADGLTPWDGGTEYPSDLPCPLIDGTASEADPTLTRTQFEGGNTRQRRKNKELRHLFALSWALRQSDEYHRFVRWANAHGFDWFKLPMAGPLAGLQDKQHTPTRVRFASPIAAELVPTRWGNYWRVSVQAEWEPLADGLGVWKDSDGVWIVGGQADAPAIDWVLAGEANAPSKPDWVLSGDPRTPAVLV